VDTHEMLITTVMISCYLNNQLLTSFWCSQHVSNHLYIHDNCQKSPVNSKMLKKNSMFVILKFIMHCI